MTVGGAAAVGAFDAAVDPFLVVGSPRVAGLNAVKPGIETHSALAKDHLISRMRPAGLMLGDSKTDIGLDPDSPAWPADAAPAFNDGRPGLSIEDVLARLRADMALGPVRRAMVLLDMQNVMTPPDRPDPDGSGGERVAGSAQRAGWAAPRDLLLATLSLDAFRASLATLAAQGRADAVDMTPQGSTGEGGFRAEARRDGYDRLFVQKDALLSNGFRRLADALRDRPEPSAARIGVVAEMIGFCRENGVALDLVVPPVHADYLEALVRAGLWPRYEEAKAELTRQVADAGDESIRLWDFGGYDAYTTERVPGPSEVRGATQWFWEPVHFKKQLGERLLAAVYGGEEGFGARLTPATIEARLAFDAQAKTRYELTGLSRARLDSAAR